MNQKEIIAKITKKPKVLAFTARVVKLQDEGC